MSRLPPGYVYNEATPIAYSSYLKPNITNAGNTSIYALSGSGGGGGPTISSFSTLIVSSLSANYISTQNVIASSANISSLTAQTILTSTIYANISNISTVYTTLLSTPNITVTTSIDLDGNILTTDSAGGTGELLLNGIPIATTQNISSLSDWSFYPAISTLNVNNNNLIGVSDASLSSINGNPIFQSLNAQQGTVTLVSADETVSITNPAPGVINLASAGGTGNVQSTITGFNTYVTATSDVSLSRPTTYISAQGGAGGLINIQSDPGAGGISGGNVTIKGTGGSGVGGVNGKVDIQATAGTAGPVTTGGQINLTAYSGSNDVSLTSAIYLSGAGINIQSGFTSPITSVAGYTFIGGNSGVNICATVPSIIPNVPGTLYMFAGQGIELGSDLYMTNVYPYQNGVINAEDITIAGRTLDIGFGPHTAYTNISTCKNISFGNATDGNIGSITGLGFINGVPYSPGGGGGSSISNSGSSLAVNSDGSLTTTNISSINLLANNCGVAVADDQTVKLTNADCLIQLDPNGTINISNSFAGLGPVDISLIGTGTQVLLGNNGDSIPPTGLYLNQSTITFNGSALSPVAGLTINAQDINLSPLAYQLDSSDNGTYIVVSAIVEPAVLDFSIGTFAPFDIIYIKNVSTGFNVDIQYGGNPVGTLYPTNSASGYNASLCVLQYDGTNLFLY